MYKTSHIIAAFITLIFSLTSNVANAAFIEDGNYVRAFTQLTVGPTPTGGNVPTLGQVTADSGVVSASESAWSGSGRARASTAGSGLQAQSTSTAPDAGGAFPSSSTATMTASWRDVLIPTTAGSPSELNFNFSVHAFLTVSQTTDSGIFNGENISDASLSVFASNNIVSFVGTSTAQMTASVNSFDGGSTSTSVKDGGGLFWNDAVFNSLGANEFEFFGDFSYTANLLNFVPTVPEAPFGAYFMGVSMSSRAHNIGGTSTADAFSTLNLRSITTVDGSIISTDNFVFESGAAISAVPLPGSLLLLISGLLGIFATTRSKNSVSENILR